MLGTGARGGGSLGVSPGQIRHDELPPDDASAPLYSAPPSSALFRQFTLQLEPMHHSVTRFHKYLHGGRFPDIRIPATHGGGYERSREMHCKTMVNQRIHGLFPNPTLPTRERIILI